MTLSPGRSVYEHNIFPYSGSSRRALLFYLLPIWVSRSLLSDIQVVTSLLLCQVASSALISDDSEVKSPVVIRQPVPASAHLPDGHRPRHRGEDLNLCLTSSAAFRTDLPR